MGNWKDILIKPDTPIFKAIEIIDRTALQVVLVVDDNNKLLGIITDGDIRRGILRQLDMNAPVQNIMHKKPVYVLNNESDEQVLKKMRALCIRHIPVVDEYNTVVGLKILEKLLQKPQRDNWVVLMAGGLGRRLGELTNNCPKPLLSLGGKPILETIIENFIDFGFCNFFISLNYKGEMIEKHFGNGEHLTANIHYVKEKCSLGTAGSLSLLPDNIKHPLIVMNADVLTKVNFQSLLDFHQTHKADATMCVTEYDVQLPYGVIRTKEHNIVEISEKPAHKFLVNAGIYVLNPEVLKFIPLNKPYDMTELFKKFVEKNMNTVTFPIREYWMDIGRAEDFTRASIDFGEIF